MVAKVKEIKSDFFLVDINSDKNNESKIITRTNVRPLSQQNEIIYLNGHIPPVILNLSFMDGLPNLEKKIIQLSEKIKNVIDIDFIFHSQIRSELFIFPHDNSENLETLDLINLLFETTKKHYEEYFKALRKINNSHIATHIIEYENEKSTKKKIKVTEKEYPYTSSLILERFIYEMLKSKIENIKKSGLGRVEIKKTNDPNKIKLDIKSSTQKNFQTIFNDLNVVQNYLSLELNEKDSIFSNETQNQISLNNYVKTFGLNSFRIFKINEESVSLQLIGPEKSVQIVSQLIEEYAKNIKKITAKEQALIN